VVVLIFFSIRWPFGAGNFQEKVVKTSQLLGELPQKRWQGKWERRVLDTALDPWMQGKWERRVLDTALDPWMQEKAESVFGAPF